MKIRVGNKTIGEDSPTFIVAEVGTNHNGDVNLALEMVDRAKEAGADAVKFQPVNPEASYVRGTEPYEIYSRAWLEEDDWIKIKERTEHKGLVFFAAPADIPGAKMMKRLRPPLVKISSPSMTNVPLQNELAQLGVPVMVSTGMSYVGEVEKAVRNLESNGVREIVLLHCVSLYPAPTECLNLLSMQTMMRVFPYPVGYSDHSLGRVACLAAVALGAKVIEKHFTLDKEMEGPEHRFSADSADFRTLVQEIREVESALGSPYKAPCEPEISKRDTYRRCLVANQDIPSGTVIREEMIGLKRPEGRRGLETDFFYQVIGRKAAKNIRKDESIRFEHLS
ncbi:MAG: N-acetylneuraminate synthase family protein [Deltaproteobacteria bacterium]|nr:N-acetylneuraminate synthase family protein [Deltaproteobacteria bacterium]